MRIAELPVLGLLICIVCPAALADNETAALQPYGVFGTWSADCADPGERRFQFVADGSSAQFLARRKETDAETGMDYKVDKVIPVTDEKVEVRLTTDGKSFRIQGGVRSEVQEKADGMAILLAKSGTKLLARDATIADSEPATWERCLN
jgi:hypothetical protein